MRGPGHEHECNEGTLPAWQGPVGTGDAGAAAARMDAMQRRAGSACMGGRGRGGNGAGRASISPSPPHPHRGREGEDVEATATAARQGEGAMDAARRRRQWAGRRCGGVKCKNEKKKSEQSR